jgi:hypothetical protein
MGSEYLCLLDRSDFALVAANFEPTEEDSTLWKRDGVYFDRQAALQSAHKELAEYKTAKENPGGYREEIFSAPQ